jgi:hypothetical protein
METVSKAAIRKAMGPLDISKLDLSAVRSGREPPRQMEGARTNQAKAEAAAKEVYTRLRKVDFVSRKRDFYGILKGDAAALGRGIPKAEDERIAHILSDPGLKETESLRVELWRRLNSICINIDESTPPEDKARFIRMIGEACDEASVVEVDRKWMEWRIGRLGPGCASGLIEGQEHFAFFAERLKERDPRYVEEDWYWAYLFHIVNETSKVRMWTQMSLRRAVMRR